MKAETATETGLPASNPGLSTTMSSRISGRGSHELILDLMLELLCRDGKFDTSIVYLSSLNCTGTPLEVWDDRNFPNTQSRLYGANGQGYRYRSNPPAVITSQNYFDNGACVNGSDPNYAKVELVPVDAPPTLKGPLTVYANP